MLLLTECTKPLGDLNYADAIAISVGLLAVAICVCVFLYMALR